jgi:hypothetical protein
MNKINKNNNNIFPFFKELVRYNVVIGANISETEITLKISDLCFRY